MRLRALAAAGLAAFVVTRGDVSAVQPAAMSVADGGQPTLEPDTSTPTPTTTGTTTQDPVQTTWRGLGKRIATPFYGAFYCAGNDRQKAIETAQVGKQAGWPTLVLWGGDYASFSGSARKMWLICAGPFHSRADAAAAVSKMKARRKTLRSIAPDLDIRFGEAYVTLVQ